jgi:glyoxylase-like metal-dependent hydrolase (beta-lactamase superfamily II)
MPHRRQFLRNAASAVAFCAAGRLLGAQTARAAQLLNDGVYLVDAGGANIVARLTADGLVLVDSGRAQSGAQVTAGLQAVAPGATVRTLFNTHYHADQTGNNEVYARAGARIVAHERTRQWMSADYWAPLEERFLPARPDAARPAETFQTNGALDAGGDRIEYGHLPLAHTSGDIYVFFRAANVIAVGDVASPLADPALDYYTGAWIGGRVDAMDILLELVDDDTRIVPAYGRVMTRSGLRAERDLMEEVRARLFTQVREGKGPEDMLESGLLDGLPRTWQDPYRFLYDAAKGLWAHHNKLDRNVV